VVVWVVQRLDRVQVAGLSMWPALQPGDRLLLWRPSGLRPGDIVAARSPQHLATTIVKRVGRAGPNGVVLLGDNAAQSTDSRHFGPVPQTSVLGRAIYRYAPPMRAGRLSRDRDYDYQDIAQAAPADVRQP
jgi:nickel-type superoxide dismutase maturation protease